METLYNRLHSLWPPARPAETLPSRATSIDTKLCYDHSRDAFVAALLGDVNANPGGIKDRATKEQSELVSTVGQAFISNVHSNDLRIAVNLPTDVYDGDNETWIAEDSWYTKDRKAIFQALENLPQTETVIPVEDGNGLTCGDTGLFVKQGGISKAIDGYVNLDDTGTELTSIFRGNVELMAHGANAPTAVWNQKFDQTGKYGLLKVAADITDNTSNIIVPAFDRVESLKEVKRFRKRVGDDVVLKGPFGTHGDEIVPIQQDEDFVSRIRKVESQFQKTNREQGFQIWDEAEDTFVFNSRGWSSGYGVVEEVISGSVEKDGRKLEVVDFHHGSKSCPVDFVPLAICLRDGLPEVPSIAVRVSGIENLNANLRSKVFEMCPLENAFQECIHVEPDGPMFNLKTRAETMSERPVTLEELREPLIKAGRIALEVRNRTAFTIERQLA